MARLLTAVALSAGFLAYTTYAQEDYTCDQPNPCVSYGIDIQGGGEYFQNVTSNDNVTFVSVFEGCQPDVANNLLVDPNGDELQCSDTLSFLAWRVLLLNPSDLASTPILNVTSTQSSTSIITQTSLVTSPAKTIKPTTTLFPRRVTTTRTITMGTISKTKYIAIPTIITKTKTMTCSVPHRQPWADPTCTITPTLVSAAALSTDGAATTSSPARRRDNARRVPSEREIRIAERKARLAGGKKEKRALDFPTTTITDLNTSDYPTTTVTSTAPTLVSLLLKTLLSRHSLTFLLQTISITSILTVFTTSTTTSIILSGTTKLAQVTITAPTPTKTQTRYTLVTKTVATITKHPTITVTIHTAPAQSTKVCRAKGGKMVG
ncbi:hypothetical protein LTR56_013135 [Elasticomyces elasticus]|nr:hypothetical protein LTR56_013135 [Elasticomyces elasticus]KAK3656689.1 hypothetical protein LTR22_009668 [Elasticomyces elasticus]KAK4921561.1 hypothetical protein LTR49_011031 [Elasticomyces elasticus]KAK5760249.1 hypothetical protein LTS12_009633 [Elasticomyces elasticus]